MKDDEGFNALTDTYENLVKAGVIDPTKVVRSALQNASSIASLLLDDRSARRRDSGREEGSADAGRRRHGRDVLRSTSIHECRRLCKNNKARLRNPAGPFVYIVMNGQKLRG